MEGITFKIVKTNEEMDTAMRLRVAIFVEEQGIPIELEKDGKDFDSVHLLAISDEDGAAIGIGRVTPTGNGRGNLSRIGVIPEYRGKGLGMHIVRELETIARFRGVFSVRLMPHAYLENFYAKLGYRKIEDIEDKVGGHALILMEKDLSTLGKS